MKVRHCCLIPVFVLGAIMAAWSSLARGVDVGPGFSGAWFDPAQDGQGWIVEVLPDGRAAVYWFTYPPAGEAGSVAWIQGTGRVRDNRIVIDDTVITSGARFGAAFDAADLETRAWGSWTMTFSDCDNGSVSFDGPASFGSGEFTLVRLSRIQGSACGGGQHDPAATGFAGSWYDPMTDGQGITLGVLPDGRALVYWFTYDPEGNQQWLIGVGESKGVRVVFPEVYAFAGTAFGEAFDPDAVTATLWGSLSLTYNSCGEGVLNYRGPDDTWGAGSMRVVRLTALAGHGCQLPTPPALVNGQWGPLIPMNPGTSEVGVGVLDGKAYVAGDLGFNPNTFLEFDPGAGAFTDLPSLRTPRHHAVVVGLDGFVYVMGGNLQDKSVMRYDVANQRWKRIMDYPIVSGHTTGLVLDGEIYVIAESGTVRRFDPAGPSFEFLGRREGLTRDHAAAVAYRGEIWWIAGRGGNPSDVFSNLGSVDIFDPVTRVWRLGPSLNFPRSGFAAAVVQGQIMVAGGEDLALNRQSVIPSLEVYTPATGWQLGPDMPLGVHGVGGASLNGRFYLLGGSVNAGVPGNPGASQVYNPG